jgi:hypothetical protein
MKMKQKLSILAASVFPALALFAYSLLGPAPVNAQSCPGGTFNHPCNSGLGCENFEGGCVGAGSEAFFAYCPGQQHLGVCEFGGTTCCLQ